MSSLPGLSILSQDPDNSGANSEDTKFISLQYDTDERVLIAGTADESVDSNGDLNRQYTSLAHAKFGNISIVQPGDGISTEAKNDMPGIFEKGENNFLYIHEETGELVTKPVARAFSEVEFDSIKLKNEVVNIGLTMSVSDNNELILRNHLDNNNIVDIESVRNVTGSVGSVGTGGVTGDISGNVASISGTVESISDTIIDTVSDSSTITYMNGTIQNFTGNLNSITATEVFIMDLPTSDPNKSGQLYKSEDGHLMVSSG